MLLDHLQHLQVPFNDGDMVLEDLVRLVSYMHGDGIWYIESLLRAMEYVAQV